MGTYKTLMVYKESRVLYKMTYFLARRLPKNEEYALSSQIRRASISITSNIAEGQGRGSNRDYIHFLYNARGSAYELESQIIACGDLAFFDKKTLREWYEQAQTVIRLLNGLIHSLKKKEQKGVAEDADVYGLEEPPLDFLA